MPSHPNPPTKMILLAIYSFVLSFTSIPWKPWEESWTWCNAVWPSAPRLNNACLAASRTSPLESFCWRKERTSMGRGHSGVPSCGVGECFFLFELLLSTGLWESILFSVFTGTMGANTPNNTHAASRSLVRLDSSRSRQSSTICKIKWFYNVCYMLFLISHHKNQPS